MADFIASGRIIDVIVALMLMEAGALYAWHRATGRGIAPPDILLNLAAGASLMLAVRVALTGGAAGWLLAFLSAALVAHVADVARRWQAGTKARSAVLSTDGGRGARVHK